MKKYASQYNLKHIIMIINLQLQHCINENRGKHLIIQCFKLFIKAAIIKQQIRYKKIGKNKGMIQNVITLLHDLHYY